MERNQSPEWLGWAREIQALAQTGLTYGQSEYDVLRYRRLAAIAAEIVASRTTLGSDALLEGFLAQPGYATPKVDVRGAVVRDGEVLLVRERADGKWCLPGGWADVGEGPSESVVREVREESGVEVVPERLAGVYDANRLGRPLSFFHAYKLVFLCRLVSGETRGSGETLAAAFFGFDDIPPLSTERTDGRHLADVRARSLDAGLPTAFD